jgi:hypothetical protein
MAEEPRVICEAREGVVRFTAHLALECGVKGVMDRLGDVGDLHRVGGRRVLFVRSIGDIGQAWQSGNAA